MQFFYLNSQLLLFDFYEIFIICYPKYFNIKNKNLSGNNLELGVNRRSSSTEERYHFPPHRNAEDVKIDSGLEGSVSDNPFAKREGKSLTWRSINMTVVSKLTNFIIVSVFIIMDL